MTKLKNKIVFILLLSFLTVLLSVCARADDIKVITSLNKRTIDINDEINMSIKIIGNVDSLERPRLPNFKGFSTYYTGRSSHFAFINGRSEHTVVFNYALVPEVVGKFTVGPLALSINRTIYIQQLVVL